jgi:hypothetical protein
MQVKREESEKLLVTKNLAKALKRQEDKMNKQKEMYGRPRKSIADDHNKLKSELNEQMLRGSKEQHPKRNYITQASGKGIISCLN